jgi:hypothetical protein
VSAARASRRSLRLIKLNDENYRERELSSGGPHDNGRDLQLGITDVRFDPREQLRRHLANTVLLGVLTRLLEYLFFRLTPHDVLTTA